MWLNHIHQKTKMGLKISKLFGIKIDNTPILPVAPNDKCNNRMSDVNICFNEPLLKDPFTFQNILAGVNINAS